MCHCSDSYLGLTIVAPCSERRNQKETRSCCRDKTEARLRFWVKKPCTRAHSSSQHNSALNKTAQGMAGLKTRQQNLHSCQHFPFREEKKHCSDYKKNQSNKQTKTTHTKQPHRNQNPKTNPKRPHTKKNQPK